MERISYFTVDIYEILPIFSAFFVQFEFIVSVQNFFVMPFQYLGFCENKYIAKHTLFKNVMPIFSTCGVN